MSRDRLGGILIACMAATTMLGSVSGLIHYAQKGAPGVLTFGDLNIPVGTLAFVAGLDGLAIALTVLAHRGEETDWSAFVGLVLATAGSTALQVAAVWDKGADAVIVHGLPAPCTGVAAFYWLRSLSHKRSEALPPPPVHVPGGITVDASASGPAAQAAPPSAPEAPPEPAGPQQRTTTPRATRGTSRPGGRPKLQGEALYTAAALWLTENERTLSARSAEEAVKAVRGSCGRALRDEVYAALSAPDAVTYWAETSATGDGKERD